MTFGMTFVYGENCELQYSLCIFLRPVALPPVKIPVFFSAPMITVLCFSTALKMNTN
jgi:hypothetical protein